MTRRFERDKEMVAESRRFVDQALPDVSLDIRESIQLMVSELATNAVTHTSSGFEVAVDVVASSVRVEVTDDGSGSPIIRTPDLRDPHGRGLQIVALLSDEWGTTMEADKRQKHVWFRVDLRESEGSVDADASGTRKMGGSPKSNRTAARGSWVEGVFRRQEGPQLLAVW